MSSSCPLIPGVHWAEWCVLLCLPGVSQSQLSPGDLPGPLFPSVTIEALSSSTCAFRIQGNPSCDGFFRVCGPQSLRLSLPPHLLLASFLPRSHSMSFRVSRTSSDVPSFCDSACAISSTGAPPYIFPFAKYFHLGPQCCVAGPQCCVTGPPWQPLLLTTRPSDTNAWLLS